jgi:hypothetical protein
MTSALKERRMLLERKVLNKRLEKINKEISLEMHTHTGT